MTSATEQLNKRLVLRRRPVGLVEADDVELVTEPVREPSNGEILMQVEWLGIDATVRTWLSRGEGYLPPVEIGDVVRCSGIGRVLKSRSDRFAVGDLAYSLPGWQEYAVVSDHHQMSNPLPAGSEPTAMMSIYGAVGATAWMGIVDIGQAKAGETVVVSAAAGATGSLASQIARNLGCRVVGICGTDEKCRWLTDELGIDAAINYRTQDVATALREHCPDKIDVYFDNVGGDILDAVLGRIAMHGRIALCGAISVYNAEGRPPGPANYLNLISRRGRMEGFLSLDIVPRFAEIATQLATWVQDGKLTWRTHIFHGLESAPDALNAMFTGDNIGKILVRVRG